MIVKSAKVIPREKHDRGIPIGALHHGVEFPRGPVLALAGAERGVFVRVSCDQPTHGGQAPVLGVVGKLPIWNYMFIPERSVPNVTNGIQRGKLIAVLTLTRSVVLPGDASRFQGVGESLKIEARGLGGDAVCAVTLGFAGGVIVAYYGNRLVIVGVASPGRNIRMRIVDDSARLGKAVFRWAAHLFVLYT